MEICQIKNTYCYYIYVTKNFLDRTLDNESYSSHGNNNDLVNIESIEDNIEIW